MDEKRRFSKTKLIILCVSIAAFSALLAYYIPREIKWSRTLKERDIMEHEILLNLMTTEEERMEETMAALYDARMNGGEADQNGQNPYFETVTEKFLEVINKRYGISLTADDLEIKTSGSGPIPESMFENAYIADYIFRIGDFEYRYGYKANGDGFKSIITGERQNNWVAIGILFKENKILSVYSDWKTKYYTYTGKLVNVSDYLKFMRLWERGELQQYYEHITLDNIRNCKLLWLLNEEVPK